LNEVQDHSSWGIVDFSTKDIGAIEYYSQKLNLDLIFSLHSKDSSKEVMSLHVKYKTGKLKEKITGEKSSDRRGSQ
jgi:hypothetical protein